jgi:hypothetical protein
MIGKDKLFNALLSFVEQNFMEGELVEFLECAGYSEKEAELSIKHYLKNQNSFEKTAAGGKNF